MSDLIKRDDAPERIWTASTNGKCHVGFDTPSLDYKNEYVRADLVDPAYAYAKHLAETIFAHGKFNVPEWKVLDDTLGVLTQIDNMVASLRDKPDPAAIREAALREAAVACDIWPSDEWHMHTKSGYIFAAEECQRNILALIGEKK